MSTDEWRVPVDEQGSRLDKFLASAPDSAPVRGRTTALDSGRIFVGDIERKAATPAGGSGPGIMCVTGPTAPAALPVAGRAETWRCRCGLRGCALVVVDKPAGWLSVPQPEQPDAATLTGWLERAWRSRRITPLVVHRIDRDTTGLVVVAKTAETWRMLKAQFAARQPATRICRRARRASWDRRRPGATVWYGTGQRAEQRPARRGESSALEAVSHVTVEATGPGRHPGPRSPRNGPTPSGSSPGMAPRASTRRREDLSR